MLEASNIQIQKTGARAVSKFESPARFWSGALAIFPRIPSSPKLLTRHVVMANQSATSDKGPFYWILAFSFLFSLFFLLPYIHFSRKGLREKINHLGKAGALTSAVVERQPPASCGDITCYYIAYRFKVQEAKGNTWYYAKVDAQQHIYRALAQIRFVNVRYLPSEPRFSCLDIDCRVSNTVVSEPVFDGFRIIQY